MRTAVNILVIMYLVAMVAVIVNPGAARMWWTGAQICQATARTIGRMGMYCEDRYWQEMA